MEAITSYANGYQAATSITVPTTLTTSETDLFIIKNLGDLKSSQLTVYGGVTLGGVASATFYYYVSPNIGAASPTWYPISLYNTSTGEITQRAVLVDSGTYATGGVSEFADNVPLAACTAFKVTGKSASGTPTLALTVMVRNN